MTVIVGARSALLFTQFAPNGASLLRPTSRMRFRQEVPLPQRPAPARCERSDVDVFHGLLPAGPQLFWLCSLKAGVGWPQTLTRATPPSFHIRSLVESGRENQATDRVSYRIGTDQTRVLVHTVHHQRLGEERSTG